MVMSSVVSPAQTPLLPETTTTTTSATETTHNENDADTPRPDNEYLYEEEEEEDANDYEDYEYDLSAYTASPAARSLRHAHPLASLPTPTPHTTISTSVAGSGQLAILTYEQVLRLDQVMDEVVPIHGRNNFPTLEMRLKDLVRVVRDKLSRDGLKVRDVRLNGGVASYILCPENHSYNDHDLIFGLDLARGKNFDRVRTAVLDSLLEFLPEGVNRERISSCSLKEAYVYKMVKVNEGANCWSLISLSNNRGRNVEIKFVEKMGRKFEFSVDSFQIILDSLLSFYECTQSRRAAVLEAALPEPQQKAVEAEIETDADSQKEAEEEPEEEDDSVDRLVLPPPPATSPSLSVESSSYGSYKPRPGEEEDATTPISSRSASSSPPPSPKTTVPKTASGPVARRDSMRDRSASSASSTTSSCGTTASSFVSSSSMSAHFYPTVICESVYGDFREALFHLKNMLIATRDPEKIRGGGLLKYCKLLVRHYRPADERGIRRLQKYMCSRFFIDFPDVNQQRAKLESYLANHFIGDESTKVAYLGILYYVVDASTVCLMQHERRQTLNLIAQLAQSIYYSDPKKHPHPNSIPPYSYESYTSPSHVPSPSSDAANRQFVTPILSLPGSNGSASHPPHLLSYPSSVSDGSEYYAGPHSSPHCVPYYTTLVSSPMTPSSSHVSSSSSASTCSSSASSCSSSAGSSYGPHSNTSSHSHSHSHRHGHNHHEMEPLIGHSPSHPHQHPHSHSHPHTPCCFYSCSSQAMLPYHSHPPHHHVYPAHQPHQYTSYMDLQRHGNGTSLISYTPLQ